MADTKAKQITDSEFSKLLSQDEELQRYLFQVFTLVALTFLLVYAFLQAKAGLLGLGALYASAAVIIAINRWAIRYHNKLAIAANVFASLGPIVLLPWQVSGGILETGLMWFPAYIIFAMFFVPGKGGSFWVMFTYGASFFLLLLQLQGTVPFPFQREVMFHFYFLGGITYALTYLFLHAQRIILDLLKIQVASLNMAEEIAHLGNWSWDIENNTVRWSDQLYRIVGVHPGKTVTYELYLKLVHPEDRQITEETVQKAMHDYQPYSLIHRVKRSNGSVVWVHSLGEVLLDTEGKPVQLFGTAQDITERMAKEYELMSGVRRRS